MTSAPPVAREWKLLGKKADPGRAQAWSTAKATSTVRLLPGGESMGTAGGHRPSADHRRRAMPTFLDVAITGPRRRSIPRTVDENRSRKVFERSTHGLEHCPLDQAATTADLASAEARKRSPHAFMIENASR